ncbi:MAG: 3-hydroxyacyl-CoA dehydrogenase NAD-binding domain-containing protein [Xanthobacteraceae bacterium]
MQATEPVRWHDDGDIRVIIAENPPVNALGFEVRHGLHAALLDAQATATVHGVVLATSGRNYFGGADIKEFGQPPRWPRIFDLIDQIEQMTKPVIAAIKGHALGGGLELAIGCHWRVATPDASLGFPEVKLGLIPGAGGTQRTPRLVGIAASIELITSGAAIPASRALDIGLIDAIAPNDLVSFATDFVRSRGADGQGLRRVRDLPVPQGPTETGLASLADARARVEQHARGEVAPGMALDAIAAGLDGDFEAGLAKEKAIFQTLMEGAQSKALRHVFLAERAAAQLPDLAPGLVAGTVGRVAIIGAGTMGRGIAIAFLTAGFAVRLIEPVRAVLDAAEGAIRSTLHQAVAKGRMPAAAADVALAGFAAIEGDAAQVGDVDLVIEAALEDLALKTAIFAALDRHAPPRAILATNTSTLNVDAIAASTADPGRVLGLHFFSPANIMKLLEVVRAAATADQTLVTALAVAKRLRKVPVVVGVCDGFVGNRMLAKRHVEAERLLIEGALPDEVDAAWVAFGFPMGPFAMTDLAGVDTNWRVRQSRGAALAIHDAVYALGRYGQKTGSGFFRYPAGQRKPEPDPEIRSLIEQASRDAGIERRAIGAPEILERLLYPMINEGARLLEEGIARRAGDIDVVWVNGYAWPAWRGGPMFYADGIGLRPIRDRLAAMHAASGNPDNIPSALLAELAGRDGTFFAQSGART